MLEEKSATWPGPAREASVGAAPPGNTVLVPIASLAQAGTPRQAGVNADHVRLLAEVAEYLPPILVHQPTMRVIDGVQRVRAALARGEDTIEVRFFDDDEAAAFVLAVESNVGHGLPLTLAERRVAAARIVRAYPDWVRPADRGRRGDLTEDRRGHPCAVK